MEHNNQKFYEAFQATTAGLESQIDALATATSRQDAIDKIRGAISNLTKSLADASDLLPTYDQKSYAETLKALTEKLDRTADKVAPRSRFQFKARSKAAQAGTDTRRLNIEQGQDSSFGAVKHAIPAPRKENQKDYNADIKALGGPVRRPSFSTAKMINLLGHKGLHIVLPAQASKATSSGSLQDIEGCIIDMSTPAGETPFAGLALKNIRNSIIITGSVSGPVHVTSVTNSILVIASRQVRIHECKHVDMYLHCTSHPIIEDCSGMRFAPIPEHYTPPWTASVNNQWDRVDDFKWLKAEHSPNWSIMPEESRLAGDFWTEKTSGKSMDSAGSILNSVGLQAS